MLCSPKRPETVFLACLHTVFFLFVFFSTKKSALIVCLSSGCARLGRAAGAERTAGRRNQRRQGAIVQEKNKTVLLQPQRAQSKIKLLIVDVP